MITKNRVIALCLVIILIFSFSACAKPSEKGVKKAEEKEVYPVKIVDSYNREVIIESKPMRIVSIAPNITETIFALGLGKKLVGRTDYCDYPEEVKNIPSIGSLMEPNIEKIVDLKPDLVVASTHFKKDVLKKLEELNIKVIVLYGEESFEGVYEVIKKLGKALDAKDEAERIVSNMKEKVSNVTEKVKNAERPEVYYVVGFGEGGDYTAGRDTFIGKMIELAGGLNAARDVEGWKYSLERLIEKDPDILICSKYYDTKKRLMNTNGYKDLTAVKKGKVFEIDNNLLERQGPRLADGLEELAKIIHPELFK
ncbi:ABC transporter substrate-binding protein [Crassaminicella thermophila]|uniref:ABC transporter substrate-binding protein n=1 Tax=Crassaminicella thermophila TaxID=2599308 RepID=A0A5C0SFT6_CRATE|nr:ABC transporter substrate-binding protein [Crassaminicella thermophila]QEK13353.1 ABC transporter substrate-binding protein [Crassaminicella thermophila]